MYKLGDLVEVPLVKCNAGTEHASNFMDPIHMSSRPTNSRRAESNIYHDIEIDFFVFPVLAEENNNVKILIPNLSINGKYINNFIERDYGVSGKGIMYAWIPVSKVNFFKGQLCQKCGFSCRQICRNISLRDN
jgi:hypothetical protein